jgi:hypothetical protein
MLDKCVSLLSSLGTQLGRVVVAFNFSRNFERKTNHANILAPYIQSFDRPVA